MRILYASDSSIPSTSANSVQVMKMCSAFASLGHQVDLLCYTSGTQSEEIFEVYGVDPAFNLQPIPNSSIPGIRRILRMLRVNAVRRSGAMYDIVYGRDPYSTLAAVGLGTAIIFEAHVPPRHRLERALLGMLFRRREFSRLIAISQALLDEYRRLYPSLLADQCVVAHDASEPFSDCAYPTDPFAWPGRPDALQAGYLGSLLPGKGAEQVVHFAARMPEVDFHIVGGDARSVNALRTGSAQPNLYFHGHVQHANVGAYLKRFDVALFPMQSRVIVADGTDIARWTSPMKLFEYMAAEKAIVSSDLPVIREVLRNDENALLVPADDIDAWCQAIGELKCSPRLRRRLGQQAHEDYLENYTWQARVQVALANRIGHEPRQSGSSGE